MSTVVNKKRNNEHHYVLWTIRSLLIISAVLNIINIILLFVDGEFSAKRELMDALSSNIELLFWAVFTFALTYLHDFFENRNIHIPDVLEIIITIYIFAGIFLSARLNLFYEFVWWDMLLHTFSGFLLGYLGFLAIYKINMKHSMDISPLFAALFAFGFSISLNVFFEIYEFSVDIIFETTLQSWDAPENMLEIGKPFQGSGLRDTMSDFICDTIGAMLVSVFCFSMYKHKKKKALEMMREIFPDEKREKEQVSI